MWGGHLDDLVRGRDVSAEDISTLLRGIQLEDGPAHFEQVTGGGGNGSNHWFNVIVKEGRNRLVRRMWEALGYTVSRLIRIRFGNVYLPSNLKRGRHVELTEEDIDSLALFLNQLEMQKRT